jgi:hypothetical protein
MPSWSSPFLSSNNSLLLARNASPCAFDGGCLRVLTPVTGPLSSVRWRLEPTGQGQDDQDQED